jgi:hypothetical protein
MLARTVIQALATAALIATSGLPAKAQGQVESKTWLINGLASAVPFIGYGFANLKKKIPGSELYSYMSPVEGSTVIQAKIMNEIRQAYRRNPNVEINLIGISFGANLITRMVGQLDKEGIPVSYLGVVDGLPLGTVTPNVRRVDNFYCTIPGCLADKIRLTRGNDVTIKNAFKFNTTHIALGDNEEMHRRILHQISTYPLNIANPSVDLAYTASTE